MGNLCSGPNDMNRGRNGGDNLKECIVIYGDYFSTDTRTIIAALDYCDISYTIQEIQTNLGELQEEDGINISMSTLPGGNASNSTISTEGSM